MNIEKELEYLLDRRRIEDICILYAHLIDTKQLDRLTEVFTEDAFIDYTATGGINGDLETIKDFLGATLTVFKSQHLMSNIECSIAQDRKTAKTKVMLFNPMTVYMEDEEKDYTFFCGAWYNDELVMTENGWRIKSRVQELSYTYNRKNDTEE